MKEANLQNKKVITKIRIVRTKDNVTIRVNGYRKASDISGVPTTTIRNIMNFDDKSANGYKFYNWG